MTLTVSGIDVGRSLIDGGLLRWFELYELEPFMAKTIVVRPKMHCHRHIL